MKWGRYIIGTLLGYLVLMTITMMVSGFILMSTYDRMELNGVLRPAQGGNTSIMMVSFFLLVSMFIATFLYKRLKKADSPILYGSIVGLLFSMTTIINYYFYMVPSIIVPIYITVQYVLGFTLGMWVFKLTYYDK